MGGRSDHTKYITELPMLSAWGEQYPLLEDSNTAKIQEYRGIAIQKYGESQWEKNLALSRSVRDAVTGDMRRRGFAPVTGIGWQGNQNQNSNGSHADILFVGHPVGGVSVKSNGTNLLNLGIGELFPGYQDGQDLFRFLCPREFDQLLQGVKTRLLDQVDRDGGWWLPRKPHYSVRKESGEHYRIACGDGSERVLHRDAITARERPDEFPMEYLRVFGNFYGKHKRTFEREREELFGGLAPLVEGAFRREVVQSPGKLAQMLGHTEQSQYLAYMKSGEAYYIPGAEEAQVRLRLESVVMRPVFDTGIKIQCGISMSGRSGLAQVDWWIRYHQGAFACCPQNMVQNLKNPAALWERVR